MSSAGALAFDRDSAADNPEFPRIAIHPKQGRVVVFQRTRERGFRREAVLHADGYTIVIRRQLLDVSPAIGCGSRDISATVDMQHRRLGSSGCSTRYIQRDFRRAFWSRNHSFDN